MILARFSPAAEDLVELIMPELVTADIQSEIAVKVIELLRGVGYEISVEVEVHGGMAAALASLGTDQEYVVRERPKRQT